VITVVVLIVVGYLLFHVGAGHAHARQYRARGLAPSVYMRAGMRGPWVSVRLPGGFRVGHRV
jgi:hypothetical protein